MKSFSGRFIRPSDLDGIGDSIMAPRPLDGIALADTYVVQIGLALGYKSYHNEAQANDTTSTMLARFEDDALLDYPGRVLLAVGPNDDFFDIPIATSESNLRTMIRKAHTQGSAVTLMVPLLVRDAPTDAAVDPWRELTRDLAAELDCELFDTYDHMAALDSATLDTLYLPADIYHITAAGHDYVTDRAVAEGVLVIP
jgi:hypothetical protein